CDTANTERIDDKRYTLGEKVIKIDHHPNCEPYGDITWVDTNASSTSELIYELFEHGKESGLVLGDEAARLIYAGIVGDTGRFMFSNTTLRTFEIASKLIQYTFEPESLYHEMYKKDIRVARLNGYIIQHFTFTEEGIG